MEDCIDIDINYQPPASDGIHVVISTTPLTTVPYHSAPSSTLWYIVRSMTDVDFVALASLAPIFFDIYVGTP